MSATSAPQGLKCVYHPSGVARIETLYNAVASTYGTGIYTGTPIKLTTDGTVVPVGTGAETGIGVFIGCFFISGGRPFQIPYWPAAQTYDANTVMWFQYEPFDSQAIYEIQANGSIAQTALGEGANLANASQGSTYTGLSTQALNATTTGATPGTFVIQNVAPYPDNAWGDAYTIVRVRMTPQVPIA